VKAAAATAPAYLIGNAVKRQTFDAAETTGILPLLSNTNVLIWPQSAIDAVNAGTTVIAPASIVKVKESGNLYLIDGWAKGLRVTPKVAAAFGVTAPKVVTRAQLVGYNTAGTLDWQKVICGANTYLVDSGALLQIDANALNQWPGTGATLDAKTCTRLAPTTNRVGALLAFGTKKYKLVDKKLRLIRTPAEYTTLSNGQTPAALVSGDLVAALPKVNPTSYLVVAKDTLYAVAVKFKTTRATLRSLNSLTTDKLTVGQVLVLP
jgi:LysM repeat protein